MRARNAFTLLEVLAAVAFVGLVFTALSRSATVGIISEGDNRRRMEAALLADAAMIEIELGLQASELPADGTTEEEVDIAVDETIESHGGRPSENHAQQDAAQFLPRERVGRQQVVADANSVFLRVRGLDDLVLRPARRRW